MRKRDIHKRISAALDKLNQEMADHAKACGGGSHSYEGRASGYAAALMDIQLLLNDVEPGRGSYLWKAE